MEFKNSRKYIQSAICNPIKINWSNTNEQFNNNRTSVTISNRKIVLHGKKMQLYIDLRNKHSVNINAATQPEILPIDKKGKGL